MKDRLNGFLAAVITASLMGGFAWVQEMSIRLALVEDDLGETVDVISLLHPPQRAEVLQQPAFHTSDKAEQRRSKLEQLREQCEVPPEPKGDDDDSSALQNS
jgi:hypothetical protein